MKSLQDTYAPGTDFHVVLKRPTPSDALLKLRARATELREDRAVVDATRGDRPSEDAYDSGPQR